MKEYSENIKLFGKILLIFEVVWILFYIGVSIGAFVVSTDEFFMLPSSSAYGQDDVIRTSLRVFKSHILVSGTVAALVGFEWERPSHFAVVFFVFLLYADISNLVEVAFFSKISSFNVTRPLWRAAVALGIYQTLLALLACLFYILYSFGPPILKRKRLRQNSKMNIL